MATVTEQYENLPGVKVNYEDGNLYTGSEATSAATKAITILGTAIDGPVGEPVYVNTIGGAKAAEKLFGGLLTRRKVMQNGVEVTAKVPHEGTLIRAMWEAIRAGNEDIRLIRISGTTAKTELPAQDPNSEVTQALADALGNQLIPGNIAFSKALDLASDQRLVKIEKVEEFAGTDTTVTPVKTFADATGYESVDDTIGQEVVYFRKDTFRPKNTIKVSYKAKKRNYTEVTRSDDGVTNPSTLGLLTQDTGMTNYFISEVGNWSDDPLHQANVYVIAAGGTVFTIPSVNSNGERLWRIGKADPAVTNELSDAITALEFQQGGIRFTAAYQAEVANSTYPALTGVTVKADYTYYNDLEVTGSVTQLVPGTEKSTFLNFIPESGTLAVYYELNGQRTDLVEGEGFTTVYPSDASGRVTVLVKSGAGPVGAKLFAYYKTGQSATQGAKLIVNAKNPGSLYGGIEDANDLDTLYGVQVVVAYDTNVNGTIDMENRVIRFIKPADKKTTSADVELRFRSKELTGIRTLREFANYVNSLTTNNIVYLEVPLDFGDVEIKGLLVTDHTVSPIDGSYDYRGINLGEKYDAETGAFVVNVDDTKNVTDPARFPWLGTDGFFNNASLVDMKKLYEALGGTYSAVEGTLDEYVLEEQGIYSKLENYSTDIIWMAEAHANTAIGAYAEDGSLYIDNTKSFATQLAQHCAMTTAKTYETIGTIGVAASPLATLREVQNYIDVLSANVSLSETDKLFYTSRGINPDYVNQHFMYNVITHENVYDDEGNPIDIGRYVNPVFGPEIGLAHEKLGNYITNGAGVYAALISTLAAEVSTTNQEIAASGLRYTLSEAQQNQLAGARYVAFERKLSQNGTSRIVVKDGVTAALPNSDYQRLSTVNITHATVQVIRQKADKFIGLPNGMAQRNSLATEIQAALDKLKELGVLIDFKFSIYSSTRDRVLGNAFITLELVPAYETRKIFTSVALRASL